MIEIENLHKAFREQKVLQGVDLHMPKGKITCIMGPSGEGKSVLLKHLIGLLHPDQGRVLIEGENIAGLSFDEMSPIRRKISMLFQDAGLFDYMNVFENVSFPLYEHTKLSDAEIEDLVHSTLEEVGLNDIDEKLPGELSGGMRKRVGLARALILEPKILLFDEPTTGLDPIITDQIADLVEATHEKRQVTMVLISHDLPLSLRLANQISMLYKGKIVESSAPEEFCRSEHPFVKKFIQAQDLVGKKT